MKPLFILLVAITTNCLSQTDYSDLRMALDPAFQSCGIRDTATLFRLQHKLLDCDTTTIDSGMDRYYEDLGMIQYELYLWTKDTNLVRQSALNDVKAASFGPNASAEWNAAFSFALLGDCVGTRLYLRRYYDSARKKDLRTRNTKDQISYLLEICPDAELADLFNIKSKRK